MWTTEGWGGQTTAEHRRTHLEAGMAGLGGISGRESTLVAAPGRIEEQGP